MWPFKKKEEIIEHRHNEWRYRIECHCGACYEGEEHRTLCDDCGCENRFKSAIVRDEWDYYPNKVKYERFAWYTFSEPWIRPWCKNHAVKIKPEGCQKSN